MLRQIQKAMSGHTQIRTILQDRYGTVHAVVGPGRVSQVRRVDANRFEVVGPNRQVITVSGFHPAMAALWDHA
jgi:hypothetical protein